MYKTLLIAMVSLCCACAGSSPNDPVTARAAQLRVDSLLQAVQVGETAQLTAIVLDSAGRSLQMAVTWTSSDSAVAMVDAAGRISGRKDGTVTITAQAADLTVRRIIEVGFRFADVAVGWVTSCGITAAGKLYCWGDQRYDVRYDPPEPDFVRYPARPVPVAATVDLRAIEGGYWWFCGLSTDGVPYCWGNNGLSLPPITPVETDARFESIAVGGTHACGLTASGRAYCWGRNSNANLGIDSISDSIRNVATPVASTARFTAIAAAAQHTCGLASDGLYCWGTTHTGIFGDRGSVLTRPTLIPMQQHFKQVTVGAYTACGIDTDGRAFCWGQNVGGSLGSGILDSGSSRPLEVLTPQRFANVAAGYFSVCGITVSGELYCWGDNRYATLGDGTRINRSVPVPVGGLFSAPAAHLRFRSIEQNTHFVAPHVCAVSVLQVVYCWGSGTSGQLGNGQAQDQTLPVRVLSPY